MSEQKNNNWNQTILIGITIVVMGGLITIVINYTLTNMNELQNDITDIKIEIVTLTNKVDNLETKVDNLVTKVDNLVTKVDIINDYILNNNKP